MLGILQSDSKEWLDKDKIEGDFNTELIEALIKDRNKSRVNKDFVNADKMRQELSDLGVDIEDTPGGTIWKAKKNKK